MGRDPIVPMVDSDIVWISTHTPAWGATLPAAVLCSNPGNFNSHARVGRDCMLMC